MLSFCGEDTDRGGTSIIVLGGWLGPVTLAVFVDVAYPLAHNNCLTILRKNEKWIKGNIFQNCLQMK